MNEEKSMLYNETLDLAKIAIDDFGSGYSSLMHIIRIDADFIKIDGEIIRTICEDKNAENLWA